MQAVGSSNIVFHPEVQTFKSPRYQAAPNECANSIQTLIGQLKISPFIVTAQLGPTVYTEAPFELKDKVDGIPVYGWKPNSKREKTTDKCFLVLGAGERDGNELVYYACAQRDRLAFGNYRRNPDDQKIYVVTLRRFQESVTHFALPLEPITQQNVELTPEETVWFNQFLKFPIETILGMRKAECKALAQKAFDAFKQQFGGDSTLAKASLVNICDAMRNSPETRQYHGVLERAWDGVGDEAVFWQA